MKKAKIEDGIDRISMLPDPILHLILSRLRSTVEVVQTSVLSTRWKYLWTSVPSLEIDHRKPPYLFERGELINFVWQVLHNRTLDLDSFTLDFSYYSANDIDMSIIEGWIHILLMRKVKKIDLKLSFRDVDDTFFVLGPCLVRCGSLEMLALNLSLGSLSLDILGSKTLKVLRLDSVELQLLYDLMQSFLENCPLLEELSLIKCFTRGYNYFSISCPNLKTLRIDNRGFHHANYEENKLWERLTVICPKLVYFEYGGHMANHFSFDVKSLKKAVIELEDMKLNGKPDDNFGVSICELLAQVSHVEYLSINRFFHQSISKRCECCNLPEEGFPDSLPNLKKLQLKFDCDLMVVLVSILKCSSNFNSLHLIIHENISFYEVKKFFEELEPETRRTLTRHLNRVEFSDFNGEMKSLSIARILLEHGNTLKEMVFSWSNRDKFCKQEAMYEVSNFYKASSSVKVISLEG